MKTLRRMWKRVAATFAPRNARQDADLTAEFESHIALLTDKNISRGMSSAEARRAALLKFGALEPAKENYRDQRALPFIDSLWQDLRYALRGMRLNPGFTAVVVLCLALGIGANAAMFTVINSVLLRPLPFKDSDRLISIMAQPDARQKNVWSPPSIEAYEQIKADTAHFSDVIAVQNDTASMTGSPKPRWVDEIAVTGEFFPMLGVSPFRGRALTPTDAQPGNDVVAVLSYKLWQSAFGGDNNAIGRTIHLDSKAYVIVGVMPAPFAFPLDSDIWVPLTGAGMSGVDTRVGQVRLTARLQRGVSLEQAQAVLTTIAGRLAESDSKRFKNVGLTTWSIAKVRVQSVRKSLLLLFGAVGLVLLIACANVANLFLARALGRQREFAVRAALGASQLRLMRQLLVEGVAIAFAGGALGLALAASCAGLIRSVAPADIPRIEQVAVDLNVVLFTVAASIVAGILLGVVPAFQFSRTDLNSGLKTGMFVKSIRTTFAAIRFRDILTVVEVALCVVLLVGSTLAMRSFLNQLDIKLGFRIDHLLTMRVLPPRYNDPKGERSLAMELRIAEEVREIPGVEAATVKQHPFLAGFDLGSNFHIPGQLSPLDNVRVAIRYVDSGYFDALRIPLLRGRTFVATDDASDNPIAVVNESFVKERMHERNPLDEEIFETGWTKEPDVIHSVIGEVADVRDEDVSKSPVPTVYVPFGQSRYRSDAAYLLVRTATPPAAMVKSIEQQVWSVDKDIPIEEVETADQLVSDLLAEPKFHAILLSAFAGLGLTLALVGIYGVVSYSVGQRTREIGIRMALGAQRKNVMLLVLAGGMLPVAIGIAIGTGGALALTRLIRSFLFEISATDPMTYTIAALSFSAVALLACYQPARRATRVDPVVALRSE